MRAEHRSDILDAKIQNIAYDRPQAHKLLWGIALYTQTHRHTDTHTHTHTHTHACTHTHAHTHTHTHTHIHKQHCYSNHVQNWKKKKTISTATKAIPNIQEETIMKEPFRELQIIVKHQKCPNISKLSWAVKITPKCTNLLPQKNKKIKHTSSNSEKFKRYKK